MQSKIIKIIASLMLVVCLASPAVAIAPLAFTIVEMAAPTVVAAGISYLLPALATTNMPKTGYADNYGVKRNMLAKASATAGILTTGILTWEYINSKYNESPSDYPALKGVLTDSGYLTDSNVRNYPQLGLKGYTVYVAPSASFPSGGYFLLGDYQSTTSTSNTNPDIIYTGGKIGIYSSPRDSSLDYYRLYAATQVVEPVPAPSPAIEWPIRSNSPTLGELYPPVLTDVDKMIQANPSALQVPGTLPNDILNAQKQIAGDTIADSNEARVKSLQDIVDAKQAAYDANPTDANKEALDKAKADLAAAEADKAEDEQDAVEDKLEEEDGALPPTPEPPEYDNINFQPLVNMGDELGTKFPFSLLTTLKNFASGLVTTPHAPTFDINFPAPFNYTWHLSLERFDGIAQMVRVLIGMAFLAYVTMSLIRRWR